MKDIAISVIIPTCNRNLILEKTIQSIKEQCFCGYEIIVVDNASDVLSDVRSDEHADCYDIRYISEPNKGLHNARHTGAKVAKADLLVYIDDDAIADKNFLSEIKKPYSDPDVGCVGGMILPDWEVPPPKWVKLMPKHYLSILDDQGQIRETKFIFGCNFSIRKELLFQCGGFNPDAFADKRMCWLRCDGEIGLIRKVVSLGKKVIYNPYAVVKHYVPRQRLEKEYFVERAFKEGIEIGFSDARYNQGVLNCIVFMFRTLIFGIFCCIFTILGYLPYDQVFKFKVKASCYKARFLYGVRLLWDTRLRRFIKTKTWLT